MARGPLRAPPAESFGGVGQGISRGSSPTASSHPDAATPERYVIELDAETDVCPPVLRLNGTTLCGTPLAIDADALGNTALRMAGSLPGLTNEHGKRIRRVRIEVA